MLWNSACFPIRRLTRTSIGRRSAAAFFRAGPATAFGRSLLLRSHGSGGGEWGEVRSRARVRHALLDPAERASAQAIQAASYLNLRARRSNYVLDAWKPSLTKIGIVATLERLDPCFVAYREARDELDADFRWRNLSGCRLAPTPTLSTLAKSRNRSSPSGWAAGTSLCIAPSWRIANRAACVTSIRTTADSAPRKLGRLTSSAQYFVATPPDLDNTRRTGGFSPLVMRYFEGLAAGTRLLGVLPRSGEYEAILPTDAFCQVSPDGSDLAQRLDEDRSNPNNQRAVDAAGEFVREHHSWRRRGEQVFDHLANGAAIDLRSMQSEPRLGRVVARVASPQDLPQELRTTERFG